MTKEAMADVEWVLLAIKGCDEKIAKLEMAREVLGDLVDFYIQCEKDFPNDSNLAMVDKLQTVRYEIIDAYLDLVRACRNDKIKAFLNIT